MPSNFLSRYFNIEKNGKKKESESLIKLEQLTTSLMAEYEPPDYTIMDLVLELNDNGLMGFDSEGTVIFNNSCATKIVKIKEIKGKSVFGAIDATSGDKLRSFMRSGDLKTCLKVEIIENGSSEFYDAAVFKIVNGKTFYIMFFVNCLEKSVFSLKKCPLKDSCPFNKKCQIETVKA